MRVLLLVTGLPNESSPARSSFNLRFAKQMSENHSVTILFLRSFHPTRPLLNKKMIEGIECYEFSCLFPAIVTSYLPQLSELSFLFFFKRLKHLLSKIELLHVVGGNIASLCAYTIYRKFEKPYLIQFIGSDVNIFLEKNHGYRNVLKAYNSAHVLCFNSKGLQKTFNTMVEVDVNQKVIYRGVNLDEFQYNFLLEDKICFLFLGGFRENYPDLKGGVTLLKSLKLLDPNEFKRQVVFKIGGPGSKSYETQFNKLSKGDLKVEFIGNITHKQVVQEMRKSHVLIIPSLHEGLPNVCFEAMASGNMIIGSKVGGIPELVDDKESGLLIDSGDSNALAIAISFTITHPEFLKLAVNKGHKKILNFSHKNAINSYDVLYKEVCAPLAD